MKKILVIDDEDDMRENIIELLSSEGYEVIGANNGEEGYRLAWQELPDLIICDILMRGLDGYGVLAKVSRDARVSDIPFLFLTARIGRDDMRKGMGLGADDYITKPFTRKEILQAVDTRLGKRQRMELLAQKKLADLRQEVFAQMPHELLAPLSVILGFSDLLNEQAEVLDIQEIHRLSKNIHHSAEQLLQLIQNYLLYSEIDLMMKHPQKLEQHRQSEVAECAAAIQGIALDKARQVNRENDLFLNLQDAKLRIFEPHLDRIVEELIEDIFRRSAKDTPVKIEGQLVAGKPFYCLRLIDHGKHMENAKIQVLNGIGRLESDIYRQQEMDIGLLLVRRLVDFYQGGLRISNQQEGGAVIEVYLPAA